MSIKNSQTEKRGKWSGYGVRSFVAAYLSFVICLGSAYGEEKKYDLEIVDGTIVHAAGVREGAKMEATLANVVDVVRQRYPEANIVMAPGLGRLRVSDLKLRTVGRMRAYGMSAEQTEIFRRRYGLAQVPAAPAPAPSAEQPGAIWEELEAIRVASGGRFVWSGPGSPTFGAPGAPDLGQFLAAGTSDKARPVKDAGLFTLHEFITPERERTIEAFNIGPYLQHGGDDQEGSGKPEPGFKPNSETRDKRLAEIEKIINQTVAAFHDRGVEAPEYQFHSGANLLIVIGSQEAVGVARKIISALPGQGGMPFAQNIPMINPAGLRTIPERNIRNPGVSPNPLPSRQPSSGLLQPIPVVPGPVPQPGQ